MGKTMKVKDREEVLQTLEEVYFDAKPALNYTTPYELLIAVILSAQCTDERVNKVTAELFKHYNTPQTMLTLTQEELEKYIYSCGFYRNKAKHILSASLDILQKYNGQVPENFKDLKSLAGVGQKTANVVASICFQMDAIAVDTHVFRVSNRLGLANATTVEKTEEQLKKAIPQNKWSKAHHWLIFHGRRICHSQRPDCIHCMLTENCKYYNKQNKGKSKE